MKVHAEFLCETLPIKSRTPGMFTDVGDVKVSVATRMVFFPAPREEVHEEANLNQFAARETPPSKVSVRKRPLSRDFRNSLMFLHVWWILQNLCEGDFGS